MDRSGHPATSPPPPPPPPPPPQQQPPQPQSIQVTRHSAGSERGDPQAHQQRMVGMLRDQLRHMPQPGVPHLGAQQASPPLTASRGLPSPASSVGQYHHHTLPQAAYHHQQPGPYTSSAAPLRPVAHHHVLSSSFERDQGPPTFHTTSSPPFAQPGINIAHQAYHSRPSPLGTHLPLPSPGYAGAQPLVSAPHVAASSALATHRGFLPPVVPSQHQNADRAVQEHLARVAAARASPAPQESYTYSQNLQNVTAAASPTQHPRFLPPPIGKIPRTFTEAQAAQHNLFTQQQSILEYPYRSQQDQQRWRDRNEAFVALNPQAQQYCRNLPQDQAFHYLDHQVLALQQERAAAYRQQVDQRNQDIERERAQDRALLTQTVEQLLATQAFADQPPEKQQYLLQRRANLLAHHRASAAIPAPDPGQLPAQRLLGVSAPFQATQNLGSSGIPAPSHPQARLQRQSNSEQPQSLPLGLPPNPYQDRPVNYSYSYDALQPIRAFSKPAQQPTQAEQHGTEGESWQQSITHDTSSRGTSVDELQEDEGKGESSRPRAKVRQAQIGRRGRNEVKSAKPRTKQIQKLKQKGDNGGVTKQGRGATRPTPSKARTDTPSVPPSRQSRASRLQSEPQERQLDSGEDSTSVLEGGSTAGEDWYKGGQDQISLPSGRVDLNSAEFDRLANIVFLRPETCGASIDITRCLDVDMTCDLLSEWALPDLGQAGTDSRLPAMILQFASTKAYQAPGKVATPTTASTLILLDAAAFQNGDPGKPVAIFALLIKDDSKIRWFYEFAPKDMLHDRLEALKQFQCIPRDWLALEPKTLEHKRLFVWLSTAFTSASRIPDHPDWAAAQLITDYCVDILDEADAERRLDRDPDLHDQSSLDLSTDRYVGRLPLAERSLCSTIGIKPSAYLLLKRRFFKDFYKDLTQHKERIPLPSTSNTTVEASRRSVARGGGGGRHGRRQKDESVKVRTVTAHQEWLSRVTKWRATKVKRLVASWRALGFLEEPRYLPWLEGGGLLEGVCEKEE
ncbi:hypothetical protein Tdes44962_MAKER08636 [Teratosphaeria destructans]|uniref:Uncharacterized protein n=1 Tax=Teratosphaeria destructans TaxID=418781 RepID=A0A9W7SVQ4_9PEZI|nr:hypothetical protein Tdes44962_MAKER08636 [Teratosphaeria destructans]